jgi:signal transduction histidine kinase
LENPFVEKTLRSTHWITQVDGDVLEIGGPIRTADGRRAGHLFVQFSLAEPLRVLNDTNKRDLLVAAMWLVLGVFLTAIFSGSFTRPIVALAEANRQIAAGRLDTRVAIGRDDELGSLARSTNEMAGALQKSLAAERRAREELLQVNQNLEQTVAQRTAQLGAANRELLNANQMEADFAAMIAHDLRSPLTSVVSTAAMLEDGLIGPVTGEQARWLAKIQTSCRQLEDLVNDFLDLSKIEAGRINLGKERFNLNGLIQAGIESYWPLAKENGILLHARLEPGLAEVEADPRRIEQILTNLLSNAIKFTPAGGAVEVGSRRGTDSSIQMWVKDAGVGISPDEMGQLFQKYSQASGGRNSKHSGTGLGLLICKMIAEAHGGSIRVESEVGRGSTFTVSLPAG